MSFGYRRRYTGTVQAVVFDWAGTTVDYGCCAPAGVFVQAFRNHGLEVSIEQARGPMGVHKREHVSILLGLDSVRRQFEAARGRASTDADVAAIYADATRLQIACLGDFADPIPGALKTVAWLRQRGIKIGSSTGYITEMMEVLVPAAAAKGYQPDAWVCASDVASARPSPQMALLNLIRLDCGPVQAGVKVGDTVADVEEGLNAGMWSVAVTVTGNEVGLTEAELAALSNHEREQRRLRAAEKLAHAGAHYVIDGVADLPRIIEDIEARLARGERP
jgi:phosphonoacetaldehyde hydrolase